MTWLARKNTFDSNVGGSSFLWNGIDSTDFESGLSGWAFVTPNSSVAPALITSEFYSSNHSAMVCNNIHQEGPSGEGYVERTFANALAGTVTFWAKCVLASSVIALVNGVEVLNDYSFAGDGVWHKYSFSITAGSRTIKIGGQTNNDYGGEYDGQVMAIYIDEIFVPSVIATTGSLITKAPGIYTRTFTTNVTMSLAYLKGAGGGGGNCDIITFGNTGDNSTIQRAITTLATAEGGEGGDGDTCSSVLDGGANNTIGGTNSTATGGAGGVDCSENGANGGAGGTVTGGTFAVTSGQTVTIIVGHGGSGECQDGQDGSVSISWA